MHGQIRVTLPVALFGVREARVTHDDTIDDFVLAVWERTQRFGEERHLVRLDRRLTGSCSEQRSRHAHDVADVKALELRPRRVPKLVAAEVELDARRAVREMPEDGLAMRAPRRRPATVTVGPSWARDPGGGAPTVSCWRG
jgi:hypothetical protein